MVTKKTAVKKRVPVRRAKKVVVEEMFDMPSTVNANVSLILYRRIAVAFIVVVAIVLAVVLYLSTVQATLVITPVQKDFASDLIVHTAQTPVDPTDIKGTVVTGSMTKTKTFAPTGTGAKKIDGVSKGSVTITNTGSAAQPLVATTRFLSTSGILFRLDKTVSVPANGSIVATVHADKLGITGDLAPTHFTIPGLNDAKQKLIFGDSKDAFVGGQSSISVVGQSEIDTAVDATKAEIVNDAKDMLRSQSGAAYDGEVFSGDITAQKVSIKPDTSATSYDVTLTVTVTGIFYDRTALVALMTNHLYDGIGQGQDILNPNMDAMLVTVEQVDAKAKTASLHAHLDGHIGITRTNKALDVGRFVGLSANDARNLLINDGTASSVDVQFFPFWISHIPSLKDHINIELK